MRSCSRGARAHQTTTALARVAVRLAGRTVSTLSANRYAGRARRRRYPHGVTTPTRQEQLRAARRRRGARAARRGFWEHAMRCDDLAATLTRTGDPDPRARCEAVRQLCPCHVKHNHAPVWDRMVAMAGDPDPKVRNWVLHVLTDGSPRSRETEVAEVLGRMHDDPEPKLRRKARKILAHYRRTGDLNIS